MSHLFTENRAKPWDAAMDAPVVFDLHARLGVLKAEDRTLDRDLIYLICGLDAQSSALRFVGEDGKRAASTPLPRLTASFDAIHALKQRCLPGWSSGVAEYPGSDVDPTVYRAWVGGPGYASDDHMDDYTEFTGPTPAIALCGAVLSGVFVKYLGGVKLPDPN